MIILLHATTALAKQKRQKRWARFRSLRARTAVAFIIGFTMSQKYLSRRQAAAYAGVAAGTLANYAKVGLGPVFIQLRGKCLYLPGDVDTWLAQHKTGGRA